MWLVFVCEWVCLCLRVHVFLCVCFVLCCVVLCCVSVCVALFCSVVLMEVHKASCLGSIIHVYIAPHCSLFSVFWHGFFFLFLPVILFLVLNHCIVLLAVHFLSIIAARSNSRSSPSWTENLLSLCYSFLIFTMLLFLCCFQVDLDLPFCTRNIRYLQEGSRAYSPEVTCWRSTHNE